VQRPSAAVISVDGLVYVAEAHRSPGGVPWMKDRFGTPLPARVSILDERGKVLRRIGMGHDDPCVAGVFVAPHGAAIDSRGDLYVAEVPYSLATRGNDVFARQISADCHSFQKLTRAESNQTSKVVRITAPGV
jgi:hypothetical protein